jgi:hypothetical protein
MRLGRYLDARTRCGSNSAVECHLAKVDVEGSNPFSRSDLTRRATPGWRVFRYHWHTALPDREARHDGVSLLAQMALQLSWGQLAAVTRPSFSVAVP